MQNKSQILSVIFIAILLLFQDTVIAQVTLNADGPGDTYELINSVLAPGYNVIETPDCAHPDFGRHIDEVYDDVLEKYVFRFHIHVTPDNDRCINFDRQRNEIKTYDKSPSSLKAVEGETVMYEWKFKIDSFFQSSSSFTHLHQLKAVGGSEESMPLITFTTRKVSPDKLELRYAKNTSQTTLKKIDLTPLKGTWLRVKEIVTYGETGRYSVNIIRDSDDEELFNYSNMNIRMWKTGASFIRPKWGIYRSLNDAESLRDEMVLFSDFSITEGDVTLDMKDPNAGDKIHLYPNPTEYFIHLDAKLSTNSEINIYDRLGRKVSCIFTKKNAALDISHLEKGIYILQIRENGMIISQTQFLKL